MTSSPPAKRFDWNALGVRVVSSIVLIPVALLAVYHGGLPFLILIVAGAALLSHEWGRMSAPKAPTRGAAAVFLAILCPVLAMGMDERSAAFLLLAFGAAAAGLFVRALKDDGLDGAYGVFYIGWPCLALVWLRDAPRGLIWTMLVLVVAWASDIAAYAAGNVFKGPKLWPRFSPNKTWAGFIGGLVSGVVAAVVMETTFAMGLGVVGAAAVGLFASLATMAGDLWESALKRRFGVKDSGTLIPGHGGLLDRVDGLMFAVIAVAAVRLAYLVMAGTRA
jgi:phosphatidate cytidylyltransferase